VTPREWRWLIPAGRSWCGPALDLALVATEKVSGHFNPYGLLKTNQPSLPICHSSPHSIIPKYISNIPINNS
jgi:hypothetical protein